MNINKVAEIINQKGYKAEVQEIVKGSTTKTAIVMGSGNVRPSIYPEQFTANDFTDEEIANKVIEIYENNKTPDFDVSMITDVDYIKENMFVSVRRPMDDGSFAKAYLDIQLVLRVNVTGMENASFKVNKDLAEKLGLDESIFDEAIKNMNFNFNPMGSIIGMMLGNDEVHDCGMYVVSTEDRNFGGAAIYDMVLLKSIADMLNSDLIIIPSSVHELIIVKNEPKNNISDMDAMVKEVNDTQVESADQLADHAYVYLRNQNKIVY